ncbi:hypothetical protein K439DRAFT_1616059 [Ramaria rubella]|nr:hypothetical protein K439DRAFT_1616059 [Ramaria rubella]
MRNISVPPVSWVVAEAPKKSVGFGGTSCHATPAGESHELTPEQDREQSHESEDESEVGLSPRYEARALVRIPKPKGEVGHPSNGGYSLQVALGWEKKQYDALRSTGLRSRDFICNHDDIQRLSDTLLVTTATILAQESKKVLEVCHKHMMTATPSGCGVASSTSRLCELLAGSGYGQKLPENGKNSWTKKKGQ